MQPLSTINNLPDRRLASKSITETISTSSLITTIARQPATTQHVGFNSQRAKTPLGHRSTGLLIDRHRSSAAASLSSRESDFAPYQESNSSQASSAYVSAFSKPKEEKQDDHDLQKKQDRQRQLQQKLIKAIISAHDMETESRRSIEWESHASFTDVVKEMQLAYDKIVVLLRHRHNAFSSGSSFSSESAGDAFEWEASSSSSSSDYVEEFSFSISSARVAQELDNARVLRSADLLPPPHFEDDDTDYE